VPDATEFVAIIRYWDFASTAPSDLNPDPDYTVGLKLGLTETGSKDPTLGDYYVLDVERFRLGPGGVEDRIRAVGQKDGPRVVQWLEVERGASGRLNFHNYAANVLTDSTCRPQYAEQKKEEKAKVAAARVKEERVFVVDGEWNPDFIAECAVFPVGSHDDQVDSFSSAIISIDKERAFVSQGTAQRVGKLMKPVVRGKRREPAKHYGY
jgi:predicted phage terminase large subunit-like protein